MDFVVYGVDGLWAFEVQNSARVRSRDLRGLRAFSGGLPRGAGSALVPRDRAAGDPEGIRCEPCGSYLDEDAGRDGRTARAFGLTRSAPIT